MTRYAALLRGINVGGKNMLPMATLKKVATDLGYADVATYVNSGNLFLTTGAKEATVAKALRAGILDETGLDLPVIVRSHAELVKVVEDNPLPLPAEESYKAFFVTFCPSAASLGLDPADFGDEDAAAHGREIYSWYPRGVNESKLAPTLGRKGAREGTARNWRTVLTLVEKTA